MSWSVTTLRYGALGLALLFGTCAVAQTAIPVPGPTVEAIKKRGQLLCGVDTGIPGFAFQLLGGLDRAVYPPLDRVQGVYARSGGP